MLSIKIPERNITIDSDDGDVYLHKIPEMTLQLEHSLISLRKWESKHHKPFLTKVDKTFDEVIDYIKCMTINSNVDEYAYEKLPPEVYEKITEYIQDPCTAATFRDDKLIGAQKNSKEFVTAETIYYWMISLQIPVEFQKWNLNQLLALIKFVNAKNSNHSPKKKRSFAEIERERAEINKARLAMYNTTG